MKIKQYHGLLNGIKRVFIRHESNEEAIDIQGSADFETAIAATGFGKFNMLLFLTALPSGMACMFATTTMAFVIPIAECDLQLTLNNKGMLNAITYLGMITSGFFWGFLSDTIGRKKLLVIGYLSNGFLVVLSGFSQHFMMLAAIKFFEGFIINGPFAALVSYMNEFHCAKYRSLLPAILGIINNISAIVLPLLGWIILTRPIEVHIFAEQIVLRSWNVFLLICAIPSLTAGFAFIMLPESPKFQMTIGDDVLAYKTFQHIYSWNSGQARDKYPIQALASESDCTKETQETKTKIEVIKNGWEQMKPLFHPPFGSKIILVATIQLLLMVGLQTLRLWLPQIFAAINSYQLLHENLSDSNADLCKMLEILHPNKTHTTKTCVVNYNNSSAFMNNILVAVVGIGCYIVAGATTYLIGKKLTLVTSSIIGGLCGACMYFSVNDKMAMVLSSFCTGLTAVSTTTVLSVTVDIFPTTLRTMTVALAMVSGRTGAMAGNLIFPSLLAIGCLPPFITIGSFILGGAILALALPRTDTKGLQ